MNHGDRVRHIAILCRHCARNVAYYRAGYVDDTFVTKDVFWINVNGNFFDIAVLEWCKLYVEQKGEHHWRKADFSNPESFLPDMLQSAGISREGFDAHCMETKTYRDKFVAHLDDDPKMYLPFLTVVIDSTIFLYDRIWEEYSEFLSDTTPNCRHYYECRLEYGRRHYPRSE